MKPTETNLENIGAICDDCARKLGFVPKDKVVGIWMDECEVCRNRKPCTDLWHDWRNKSEMTLREKLVRNKMLRKIRHDHHISEVVK